MTVRLDPKRPTKTAGDRTMILRKEKNVHSVLVAHNGTLKIVPTNKDAVPTTATCTDVLFFLFYLDGKIKDEMAKKKDRI